MRFTQNTPVRVAAVLSAMLYAALLTGSPALAGSPRDSDGDQMPNRWEVLITSTRTSPTHTVTPTMTVCATSPSTATALCPESRTPTATAWTTATRFTTAP